MNCVSSLLSTDYKAFLFTGLFDLTKAQSLKSRSKMGQEPLNSAVNLGVYQTYGFTKSRFKICCDSRGFDYALVFILRKCLILIQERAGKIEEHLIRRKAQIGQNNKKFVSVISHRKDKKYEGQNLEIRAEGRFSLQTFGYEGLISIRMDGTIEKQSYLQVNPYWLKKRPSHNDWLRLIN